MESLTVEEGNAKFWELLERVEKGEAFSILQDGRPVARLLPVTPEDIQEKQPQ